MDEIKKNREMDVAASKAFSRRSKRSSHALLPDIFFF